jgi:hypothetical protein
MVVMFYVSIFFKFTICLGIEGQRGDGAAVYARVEVVGQRYDKKVFGANI